MVRKLLGGAAVALVALLVGCGPNYSPNTYSSAAVQQANKVERGEIVGVRNVGVSADATLGTVTGGAAGGIAGSQVDHGGPITALTTLGGTVLGGLVGAGAEHATGDTTAFEYIVRQSNGDLVSVTQKDTVPLAIGQKVLVITGKQARVVPDYTVSVPDAAKPMAKTAEKEKPEATPAGAPAGSGASAAVGTAAATGTPAAAMAPTSAAAPSAPAVTATPLAAPPAAAPAAPGTSAESPAASNTPGAVASPVAQPTTTTAAPSASAPAQATPAPTAGQARP